MFFPFMMELTAKTVLVVGGGHVALHKCRLFADFGAAVTAAAPQFCPQLLAMPGLQRLAVSYHAGLLQDAFAVVAATNDETVNRQIAADCAARHIPVNVVDAPALCSFIVPATVRRGDLVLSVSTGGKSPALAAHLRRELERLYPMEYETRLMILGKVREQLLAAALPPQERQRQLLALAELPLEELQKLYPRESQGTDHAMQQTI